MRVLDTHADFVPVHESLGQVYMQLQQAEDAERHFLKAIALNPARWKAHAYLGIIYDIKGNYIRAILEHKGALALNPNVPEIYNNLGVSYSQLGKHDQAIQYFQKAIKHGADKSQVYNNLGLLLTKKEEFPKALEAFHQGETDAKAYNNVGVTMLNAGYVSEAIGCFERALEAQGNFYKKANDNLKRAHKVMRQRLDQGGEFTEIGQSPCTSIF
jgi:Flp pilus assembly protein TadD